MDTIYLVEYNSRGHTMGQRYATSAQGVEAIVKKHYRGCFGHSVSVDVNIEALTATVSRLAYGKTYRILRYSLDKSAR